MDNKVIISVVIPCYNHGKYLQEAINSVQSNIGQYPVEIIIVNDGSNDENTLNVFKGLEDKGLFVLHQENQGLAKARNNGISLAKGKYIIPLDSDNKLTKEYMTTAIDLMEKDKSIDIVYGDAEQFGEQTGRWGNQPFNIDRMLYCNHIDACAVFRKKVWKDVNGYSEDMPCMGYEDWNLWLKAYEKNKRFYYLEKICFHYRVLTGSMIRSVTEDFQKQTFDYHVRRFYATYSSELITLKKDLAILREKNHNIFHGNIFKKTAKLILNHFKLYKY